MDSGRSGTAGRATPPAPPPTAPASRSPAVSDVQDCDFVHCHLHTRYSILDGMARPADVVAKVAALGQPAVAVTDHGGLYGAIEFAAEARAAGVRPLLGCEV